MRNWSEMLVERLEVAYRQRFDRDAALIFLNDAYQEYLFWRLQAAGEEISATRLFCQKFMDVRDLFICQLVDRYPSNYGEVQHQIEDLKKFESELK